MFHLALLARPQKGRVHQARVFQRVREGDGSVDKAVEDGALNQSGNKTP